MKANVLFLAAIVGSLLSVGTAEAQTRYSAPAYRPGVSRSVYYSRSNAVVMGEEQGCATCGDEFYDGCGCDYCHGRGCGRCCRMGVLGWVAQGVGHLADGIGATLDCLFPCGGGCCGARCCEAPCGRPARACFRRGCVDGCAGGDCVGCSTCGGGHSLGAPHMEDEVTPDAPPTPTPSPEAAPKDARQYRSVPSARPTTARPRNASAPRVPTRVVPSKAVAASYEEEVSEPVRAPRSTGSRTRKEVRPVAAEEAIEYEVVQPTRVPVNPLRSR